MNGMHHMGNASILFLIDGIISSPTAFGARLNAIFEINIYDIERIEVLRGPVSALYGADAFAGVINIVTKGGVGSAINNVGTEISNHKDAKIWGHQQFVNNLGRFNLSYNLTRDKSEKIYIKRDGQTLYDEMFGTNASLAPSNIDYSYHSSSLQLDWKKKHFQTQFKWQTQFDKKLGASGAEVIIPENNQATIQLAESSVKYKNTFWDNSLKFDANTAISYYKFDKSDSSPHHVTFPAGAFNNGFPEGVVDEQYSTELFFQSDVKLRYRYSLSETTIGAGFNILRLISNQYWRNFSIDDNGVLSPLPEVSDFSQDVANAMDRDRKNYHIMFQNSLNVFNDLDLLIGIRYDKNTDFGDYISPRLGAVWHADYNKTVKFHYGRAYLTPSMFLMFSPKESSFYQGNPNLKPQSIDMFQFSFIHQFVNSTVNYGIYYFKLNNMFSFDNGAIGSLYNADTTQTGYGAQIELTRKFDWLNVVGNYSFQDAELSNGKAPAIYIPKHMVFLNIFTNLFQKWKFALTASINSEKELSSKDHRGTIKGYTVINGKVEYQYSNQFSIFTTVKNIFDSDARSASFSPGYALPGHVPLYGRTFLMNLSYNY